MNINQQSIDAEALARQALNRLAQEEAERVQQEQQAHTAHLQTVRAEYDQREAASELQAIAQLRVLLPMYERRRTLVEQLTDPAYAGPITPGALTELCKLESEIRELLSSVDLSSIRDPYRPWRTREALKRMRESAGLAPQHWDVGIRKPANGVAGRMARSLIRTVTMGMLRDDQGLDDGF